MSMHDAFRGDPAATPAHERRVLRRVVFLAGLAALAVVIGVIVGLRMALHAYPVECRSGPGHCYAHPHAGVGTGIVVTSLLLGVLVVLGVTILGALLRRGRGPEV